MGITWNLLPLDFFFHSIKPNLIFFENRIFNTPVVLVHPSSLNEFQPMLTRHLFEDHLLQR